ncbi:uncharacterized protein LOC120253626 [Dioscorea cayenensis subsp. rotundata]|uniref:Uncharacterized protein LOC120253626 n=1 Tax=Dioscorea cayennensis subsp. rotundata TaxID=55577 RepID=A0AB40ASD5_DIOCR|nr:uncharacterized protein LOC120253626 [Dioscorea cayenensis subsp. rotundata]
MRGGRRGGFTCRGLLDQFRRISSPEDQETPSTHDARHDDLPSMAQRTPAHVTSTPALPRPLCTPTGYSFGGSSSSSVSTPCAGGAATHDGSFLIAPASGNSTSSMDGVAHATNLGRRHIQVVNGVLHPSDVCARRITSIFKERMDENGHCWKNVSKETKDFYWNEFQKHFIWDESISSIIKLAWQRKAAERYRSLMCVFRKGKGKTLYVSDTAWQKWNEAWNSSDFKAKSLKFSANRLTEAEGPGSGISRHSGGSISHICHAEKLRSKLGRDPLPYELFEATHTKKGTSELIDTRAQAIKFMLQKP